jgi:hypothetical protein
MRKPSPAVRGEAMPCAIVKRRVHQNTCERFRREPSGCKDWRPRQDVKLDDMDTLAQSIALRILPREISKASINFNQGEGETLDPACERQSRRAYSRAEFDRVFASARRACGRQQNGVVTDAMPVSQLPQMQPTSEHRVVGDMGCFAFVRLRRLIILGR